MLVSVILQAGDPSDELHSQFKLRLQLLILILFYFLLLFLTYLINAVVDMRSIFSYSTMIKMLDEERASTAVISFWFLVIIVIVNDQILLYSI